MDWNTLLCDTRIRELLGGEDSRRIEGERRTEFDRDYDRAIFSNPVKRLQDKAQVFPLEPNDSVRTRLTHSLEVSTVAKGLAGSVAKWLHEEVGDIAGERDIRAIEAIAMTCGVIHDLGNPPFGHAGEMAIQDWFADKLRRDKGFFSDFGKDKNHEQLKSDFLRFEGNAQTLRLMSRLQILLDLHGLNLTAGTFSAACKYTASSAHADPDHPDHGKSKPGYFASEDEVIREVREATGTGDARNPITFLVEASDDAVYSTADLADGGKKGVLDWRTIEKRLKGNEDELIRKCLKYVDEQMQKVSLPISGRAEDEARIQVFGVAAVFHIVKSAFEAFKENYEDIMTGEYQGELVKDSRASELVKACKRLGQDFVYCADSNLRLEISGRRVIHDLMDLFWEAAEPKKTDGKKFEGKLYSLMSKNYRTVCEHAIENGTLPEKYYKLQLLTDYLCGMTDGFACDLHRRLTNG